MTQIHSCHRIRGHLCLPAALEDWADDKFGVDGITSSHEYLIKQLRSAELFYS
jgi:hypothetical protein